jgi:hypothetical protein
MDIHRDLPEAGQGAGRARVVGVDVVSTIAAGCAPGPKTASAAVLIAAALLGQPASTSVQTASEPTR